jgi:hypothetical protein
VPKTEWVRALFGPDALRLLCIELTGSYFEGEKLQKNYYPDVLFSGSIILLIVCRTEGAGIA